MVCPRGIMPKVIQGLFVLVGILLIGGLNKVAPTANGQLVWQAAPPEDHGTIIIPKVIFPEGKGLPIPIYVPPVINGSNAFFGDWENLKEISRSEVRFSKQKLLENLIKSTPAANPEHPQGAVISLLYPLLKAASEAFVDGFKITIQKNPQGKFRAIIQILTDEGNALRKNAGRVISSPSLGDAGIAFSRWLQERFSLPESDFLYQAHWIIDKSHKKDPYVAYLSLRLDKQALLITPKIYPNGNFKIMKVVTLFGGPTVFELKGREYISAWSFLIPAQKPGSLKALELIGKENVLFATPKILFLKKGQGDALDLLAINPDGSEVRKVLPTLLPQAGCGNRVTISPNGREIAVSTPEYDLKLNAFLGESRIEIINLGNPTQKMMLSLQKYGIEDFTRRVEGLRWSPDGTKIAFVYEGAIYVINVDGTGLTRLLDNKENYNSFPNWYPDSKKIIFLKKAGKEAWEWRLFIAHLDGRIEPADLSPEVFAMPVWSPDGRKVAFTGKDAQLWIGDFVDGQVTNLRRLTTNGVDGKAVWDKYWSNDGGKIAFTDFRQEILAVIDSDGSNLKIQRGIAGLVGWTAIPITEAQPKGTIAWRPSPVLIRGKYFLQENPKNYLELHRDKTAIWKMNYYIGGLPPEDIYWRLDDEKNIVYLYGLLELREWERKFLVKGDGVLVRSLDGTAWVKEGISYSFSLEEVSGTYKPEQEKTVPLVRSGEEVVGIYPAPPPRHPNRLELRPDRTCTLVREWGINASASGSWRLDGNVIRIELKAQWGSETHTFRVVDPDTLIEEKGISYVEWSRQKE